MPQGATLRVRDYTKLVRACDAAEKETKQRVRATFRKVGDPVKLGASERLGRYSPRSAAGFRTVVRVRGVTVEQSLRRTTGQRPKWGTFQMREALIPSLQENEERTVREFENAMDTVCDHFLQKSPR